MRPAALFQIFIEGIARITPYRFLRKTRPELPQKRQKRALVARLERLTPQKGKPRDKTFIDRGKNLVFRLFRVRRTVRKIPRFRIEASLAAVRASAHEKGNAHADAVRDVVFFDGRIIHGNPLLFYFNTVFAGVQPQNKKNLRFPEKMPRACRARPFGLLNRQQIVFCFAQKTFISLRLTAFRRHRLAEIYANQKI